MINFLVKSMSDDGQLILKDEYNNTLFMLVDKVELVKKGIKSGDWVHFTRQDEIVKD